MQRIALAFITTLVLSKAAMADDESHWKGYAEAEGKWGSKRSLGEVGLFIPVWQNDDTLLAADIRRRIDDANSQEGNYGLSLRHLFSDYDVILGGYGYFDRRRTPHSNVFQQATLGVEALTEDYEARFNAYLPESDEKLVSSAGSKAFISSGTIQITTTGALYERALPGFDAELGAKFDLSNEWKLWVYGGGFYFDADDYDKVAGPRGRVELSRMNIAGLDTGSRLTFGVEAQQDSVRGGQFFAIARLRVPFSVFGGEEQSHDLSPLQQRMASRIYRDVDIVSGQQSTQDEQTETGLVTLASGAQTNTITVIDDNAANPAGAIAAAGANSLVVLDGSAGQYDTLTTTLQSGQMLIGGGGTVNVAGASGATAVLQLPGTRPTLNGTSGTNHTVVMANNSILKSIDVTGGQQGVRMNGVSNVRVEDVHVDNTGQHGMAIVNGASATIRDVELTNLGQLGLLVFNGSATADVQNITIDNTQDNGIYVDTATLTLRDAKISNVYLNNGVSVFQGTLNMYDTTISGIHNVTNGSALRVWNSTLAGSGNRVVAPVALGGCDNDGGNTGTINFDDVLGAGPSSCP